MVNHPNRSKAVHREYLTAMFARRYPDAQMRWTQPLKKVDTHMLLGKLEASGEGYKARSMQAIVYLPKDWREGARYLFL